MSNDLFYMPTKIVSGKDCLKKHKGLISRLGKNALIVTGKHSSKKNGSLNDVKFILNSLSINFVIFDDVEENPSLETIDKIATLGKSSNVDFIIGIGGGSPLDSSKAAGVLIKNESANLDSLFNDSNLLSLPIVAIPTTAGTGSETTPYAIVTDHNSKTKRGIIQRVFPKISFLDATYFMETPKNVTINTSIDSLSHLIEGYLSSNANLLSDSLAEKGLEYFGQCLESLEKNTIDFDTREKLVITSTIAGMVISQSGTSLPHGMGYSLTYFKGIPHGRANGFLLKSFLQFHEDKQKVNKILTYLNFKTLDEFGDYLKLLLDENLTLSKEEILSFSHSMSINASKLKNHPFEVTEKDIIDMYTNSL